MKSEKERKSQMDRHRSSTLRWAKLAVGEVDVQSHDKCGTSVLSCLHKLVGAWIYLVMCGVPFTMPNQNK
jgi:hypothetical protein